MQVWPIGVDYSGRSPVCVRAVFGDDYLQLAQPSHRRSVSAGGKLQKEALLLLAK